MSDDALQQAVAAHQPGADQVTVEFTIPPRGPYERAAHPAVKNRLWKLGLQDRTVLDALGVDQAKAVEDQIRAAQRRTVAGIVPYKWPRRIVGWFAIGALLVSIFTQAIVPAVLMIGASLLWALLYARAQARLRAMGLGSTVSYAEGRAVFSLSRRL